MRRLSSSEKSTPVVCAPSRSVVSNRYSRSLLIFSHIPEAARSDPNSEGGDADLHQYVEQPVPRLRRVFMPVITHRALPSEARPLCHGRDADWSARRLAKLHIRGRMTGRLQPEHRASTA